MTEERVFEGVSYHLVKDFPACSREKEGRTPLLDVRSPSEYGQGHIPGAVNLPLFSDAERAEVGTLYKRQGKEQAVLCGLDLVGAKLGDIVRTALALAHGSDPQSSGKYLGEPANGKESLSSSVAVYCWRGGMRSSSVAWLLAAAGLRVHVLAGGYKAFRRFVLESLEQPQPLRVLGGKTGAGKTEILALMRARGAQVVDLEDLARHRGSAFGSHDDVPQPSCEHFENRLALGLARCDPARPIWVEDECENLGTVNLPRSFFLHLRAAPVVVVETPHDQRLGRVLAEYGGQSRIRMAQCLDRIKKRLGGLEHKRAHACLADKDLAGLAEILFAYYDKAYAKQLTGRPPVDVIRADSPEHAAEAVLASQLRNGAYRA